ncbi:MAG: nicotinate (nicotinamide) nucleotide adenylyltransferase [Mariprofundus sp.]|nr:nicotinate (nicotinamide) nucleotide adenylyltransferase [Mariprofundus sp.]
MNTELTGKHIGLFGGSFDPPHLGHVALVQAGLQMGLDEVWVFPALPVHRELSGMANGRTRFDWLQQIFSDQPEVRVLDWEIVQNEPTPAVATLRRFHQQFPEIVPWLMLGADAWAGLESWQEYPAHIGLCNVAVFARSGIAADIVASHQGWQRLEQQDWRDFGGTGRWCYIPVDLPDISATEIRHRTEQERSLESLVPLVICDEVEENYIPLKEKM